MNLKILFENALFIKLNQLFLRYTYVQDYVPPPAYSKVIGTFYWDFFILQNVKDLFLWFKLDANQETGVTNEITNVASS